MNIKEYQTVKNFTYLQYCDYLQKKYGLTNYPYFTKSWNKNPKVTRTKEGLLAHHKYEDHAIMLGDKNYAMKNPYEWQLPENIVFCDYLEHLFLHILICENPSIHHNENELVGLGGVINFIVPELNDFYSGFQTAQPWRQNCYNLIVNDKEVYFELLKRFKQDCKNIAIINEYTTDDCLYTSLNEKFGLWSKEKNAKLYKEIENL